MRNPCSTIAVLSILCLNVVSDLAQTPPPARSSSAVETRVESLLSQMTLDEKIDMLGGVDGFFIRGMPRLGLLQN